MEPKFEPRQPGCRVSTVNHHRNVMTESKGNVKMEKKIKNGLNSK